MNNKELELQKVKARVLANWENDPIASLYELRLTAKDVDLFQYRPELRELEQAILHRLLEKKREHIETQITTEQLIDLLAENPMGYDWMLFYNALKMKDDLKQKATHFNKLFNKKEDIDILIFALLSEKKIDYDYKIGETVINPAKCVSLKDNDEITNTQKMIVDTMNNDVVRAKTAISVFYVFITSNWKDYALGKEINCLDTIVNVTDTLLGIKDEKSLNAEETKLFEVLKKTSNV
ncbi:hypothetical protein ACWXVL_00660 [Mycoplasma sp. 128]